MTHPNEGDFADDETVGASNRKDTYDDENTVATANLPEESISGSEESRDEEEDEKEDHEFAMPVAPTIKEIKA